MKKTLITLLAILVIICCAEAACAEKEMRFPCSVRDFYGLQDVDTETAVITSAEIDCEEGPVWTEITEEDRAWILDLLDCGVITGKENDMSVTGGTTVYSFSDAEGKYLGSIELYRGLAVGNDGMYGLSLQPADTGDLSTATPE